MPITCPTCGRTSYNPTDVVEGYCGYCHDWTRPQSREVTWQGLTPTGETTKVIDTSLPSVEQYEGWGRVVAQTGTVHLGRSEAPLGHVLCGEHLRSSQVRLRYLASPGEKWEGPSGVWMCSRCVKLAAA